MLTTDRRTVIKFGAALIWTVAAGSCRQAALPWKERRDLFPEGVASGDPTKDSVILWTRCPRQGKSVETLNVEVAVDEAFAGIVAQRRVTIDARLDWTVRVLVEGLNPDTVYWYRFSTPAGEGSRIGRTITSPADDDPRPVRFAFVSCQDLNQSALNAYRRMMFEDRQAAPDERLRFVLHLGDFIYEILWYPEERKTNYDRTIREVTRFSSNETWRGMHIPTSLEDYRAVWRAYLSDPDLQDIRAWLPFVCIWDNHEFSWRGWQSFQIFGDKTTFTPSRKVSANQAWFEFQPARLEGLAVHGSNAFVAPKVTDHDPDESEIERLTGSNDNLSAIGSLKAWRSLRCGRNIDLIITDLFSHKSRERSSEPGSRVFSTGPFSDFFPESVMEILDAGSEYAGGKPPDRISFGEVEATNYAKSRPPATMLGSTQKAWMLETLKKSEATWKIWACSNGILDMRADPQNLPEDFPVQWPKNAGYACFGGGDFSTAYSERAEVFAFIQANAISGFAVVSGDRHSFWAGLASASLPPKPFEPVGPAFITGSVSAPGLVEALEHVYPNDGPLRALFLSDNGPEEKPEPTVNLLLRHGVRTCLDYHANRDLKSALALSNPDLTPNLSFVDMGGHGYAIVRATPDALEAEFVCVPRPVKHSGTADGGPIRYRLRYRADLWTPGDRPALVRTLLEGNAPYTE